MLSKLLVKLANLWGLMLAAYRAGKQGVRVRLENNNLRTGKTPVRSEPPAVAKVSQAAKEVK